MLREVTLPESVRGRLLLHSMPGRYEPLESAWAVASGEGVRVIVRLTEFAETRVKSPEYAHALSSNAVPFEVFACEMPDFGVPDDWEGFRDVVQTVSDRLRAGDVVLVHCGEGIGRTGMYAICVLLALGESLETARDAVAVAGSHTETREQLGLIDWYASHGLSQP